MNKVYVALDIKSLDFLVYDFSLLLLEILSWHKKNYYQYEN